MSWTGGGVFNNYDASAERSGAPQPGTSHGRKGSSHGKSSVEDFRGLHLTTSRRKNSEASELSPRFNQNGAEEIEKKESVDNPPQSLSNSVDEEDARREEEVTQLARKLTQQSTFSEPDSNPIEAEPDSKLNPNSSNFSAKAWAKALLKLQLQDNRNPARTAGIAFRNLHAFGFGASTDYQKTVGNVWFEIVGRLRELLGSNRRRIDILQGFDGIVRRGEMLVVLGPPGSGCSTLLKTISGETHGFSVDKTSYLNYQGISAQQMHKDFRGEAIYTAEVDVHFPMLTVGDTLTFAARARAPRHPPGGVTKNVWANHLRDVMMAIFGITHTFHTRVGNDYVRGISGGERKRVTIAEAALSGAPLQCWDNSTRGLDSANAIEFCKTLRISTDILGATACVSIYQAPQSAYDLFDKAIVLYEGQQIFFGHTTEARNYFEKMGFDCPDRQTTADFLTSMTSTQERVARPGFENKVPRTAEEFSQRWRASENYARLMEELDQYDKEFQIGGEHLQRFKESRKAQQAKAQRVSSAYTLSYFQQVKLCLWRGFQRLKGDPSLTLTQLFGNGMMALIIGSVFYNLRDDTNSFFQRGALLFFAVLMNAFGSALEILTLYAQRPIVEKHERYAFYHPSAEAVASMLTDMPYKILNAIVFNITLYFMSNLRREPGPFFTFFLFSFILMLTMSMFFRTIASVSRSLAQAMAPAAILILAIVIYTGFAIPIKDMPGWSRWINYIDPVAYGFESLMINEFHNRNFTCSVTVPLGPGYGSGVSPNRVCSVVGSKPNLSVVSGDDFLTSSYHYDHTHKWRNFGILFGFLFFLMFLYLAAAEVVRAKKSKGEVLVFRRGHIPAALKEKNAADEEASNTKNPEVARKVAHEGHVDGIQKQTAIFSWRNICYEIKIKGETKRILDYVDGWVKPGTLTALMGVSGAGKTTLLDALATRTTIGVVTGEMLVDGRQRDASFQRKTGYVQQQDLHLSTATVREALNFSALLRQPARFSRKEKLEYVDEVIKLLDMEEYADAVVGVPGEGLNVEQRKRLTIGVELAAKPELLLFLDEPTSGLDSQTSWAICDLMEKLTKNGQAILCTIHQPSAMLFQRFDRLLFLKTGGQTVYYGEIGKNSSTLISYFERNGGFPCPRDANPAEWMLQVIGAAPGSQSDVDWFQTWRDSPEYTAVQNELERLKTDNPKEIEPKADFNDKASYAEFAAPFSHQMWEVLLRVFQQYWRTPSYIYSKTALCLFSGLFIGFSFFNMPTSLQGLQNQMFAIFMLFTIFGQLVQQMMPHFVTQRALYEVRERPSKVYSWKAFMLSNIIVELPWQTLMSVIIFFTWYYPIGMYRNAIPTHSVHQRGGLFFLLVWEFLIFTSTFCHMVIAAIDSAEEGGNIANLMFSLCLIFCGVLASPTALPGFWIFMYYLSPFHYLVSAMLSVGVANTNVVCAANEYLHFDPILGSDCGTYLKAYISFAGGYVQNPTATKDCSFCPINDTNTFLSGISAHYSDRWKNFGILFAFIIFNTAMALFLYWLARVPKNRKSKKSE